MQQNHDTLSIVHKSGLVGKAAFDISKGFTVGGISDRLQLTGELFLNGAGINDRILNDSTTYRYAQPVGLADSGMKKDFFINSGLYTPNELGKCYAALFTSFSHFIISDLSLSANAMINCTDGSAIVVGDISYTNLANLTIDLSASGFVGKAMREYTAAGAGMDVRLSLGLAF